MKHEANKNEERIFMWRNLLFERIILNAWKVWTKHIKCKLFHCVKQNLWVIRLNCCCKELPKKDAVTGTSISWFLDFRGQRRFIWMDYFPFVVDHFKHICNWIIVHDHSNSIFKLSYDISCPAGNDKVCINNFELFCDRWKLSLLLLLCGQIQLVHFSEILTCNSCNRKLPNFNYSLLLRRTMKERCWTVTPIIATKLPGLTLFIQLCCLPAGALAKAGSGCEARPGRIEMRWRRKSVAWKYSLNWNTICRPFYSFNIYF